MRAALSRLVAGVILAGLAGAAHAIIFHSSGDPNFNTTAPTGSLANSGWQWVGSLGGYQGTPIGPRHFIAARHIGVGVGTPLVLNGVTYPTTAVFDDTVSDLRIFQIDGTFPSWAPIYRLSNERFRTLMIFGRGLPRGTEVRVNGALKGWNWASYDGRLRWGQNTVSVIFGGVSYWGQLLYATFDAGAGVNEAHMAANDSSGPVFINDGGGWKLAGLGATVDGPYSYSEAGPSFNAALFDTTGLYRSSGGGFVPVTDPPPAPSGFYATRVSVRAGWIDSILALLPQSIDFPPIADRTLAQSPFTPTVSASSGLPVALSVVSGPATASGTTVTLTGAGTVTLRATQTGNGTYGPATPVDRTFSVTAAPGGGGSSHQVPLPGWLAGVAGALLGLVGLRGLRR